MTFSGREGILIGNKYIEYLVNLIIGIKISFTQFLGGFRYKNYILNNIGILRDKSMAG